MRSLIALLLCLAPVARSEPLEVAPMLRLLWSPETRTPTATGSAGCMPSSIRVAGTTFTAEVDGRHIRIAGGIQLGAPPVIAAQDFTNCPETTRMLTGVAPGTWRLRQHGKPLRRITLADDPLEIGLSAEPWLTPRDLRNLVDLGTNRIWGGPPSWMPPTYPDRAGTARIREMPDSLLIHVIPDPLLYWSPHSRRVVFRFRLGCLRSSYLYPGAGPSVVFNPRQRSFTVPGDIRCLHLPPGPKEDAGQGSRVRMLGFDNILPDRYRVRQDGAVLFEAECGRLDFNIDRFGMRLLE